MAEPVIIDTTVIQVKSTTQDSYGNLIITPISGENIRIAPKRRALFDMFQEGRSIKLYWAEYMHKKYVARAELFDGEAVIPEALNQKPARDYDGERRKDIREALAFKEIGEMIRAGKVGSERPEDLAMRMWYRQFMLEATGIKVPESKLVEQPKN